MGSDPPFAEDDIAFIAYLALKFVRPLGGEGPDRIARCELRDELAPSLVEVPEGKGGGGMHRVVDAFQAFDLPDAQVPYQVALPDAETAAFFTAGFFGLQLPLLVKHVENGGPAGEYEQEGNRGYEPVLPALSGCLSPQATEDVRRGLFVRVREHADDCHSQSGGADNEVDADDVPEVHGSISGFSQPARPPPRCGLLCCFGGGCVGDDPAAANDPVRDHDPQTVFPRASVAAVEAFNDVSLGYDQFAGKPMGKYPVWISGKHQAETGFASVFQCAVQAGQVQAFIA